ncbi:MAG TPA: hypothetical protein PLI05_09560 [Methanotrichaceae archaeon]|nr:hypothetical protein [Methanotrichaceae archaeon]HQF17300.1 hypothetical protein [Methanotrichaceae archaeon]HQI91873.1 hypothetical protein [Methanotrichaceae archaeon]
MKRLGLFAAVSVLCLLACTAFAVAKSMPAVVDDEISRMFGQYRDVFEKDV